MAHGIGDRITFALRQAAIIVVVLGVAGGVVERLRPDEATDRGFTSTGFWWAAVLWAVVLLADALIFERSQLRRLEGPPLALATVIGVVVLILGLVTSSGGSVLRRVVYLVANAGGAVAFWWAVIGLLWLVGSSTVTGVRHRDGAAA